MILKGRRACVERYTVKLAGHRVIVESRYESSRRFFSDYIVPDGDGEILASVSDEEILRTQRDVPDITGEMAELTGLYRPIAEAMPALGGVVFHGAAISYGEGGYIFTAPSGTGKSTHIRLWRKYLGKKVDIINGDKPIITADDGGVTVHGTPWSGKERWQKNRSLPLKGICLLHRGEECRIKKAEADEFLPFLISQTYRSSEPDTMGRTMELLDRILRAVPVYSLFCDMSEDAVRCSFEGMCLENYEENKVRTESL